MALRNVAVRSAATPVSWRSYQTLHVAYAAIVVVLVASGLLIYLPNLRAALLGGYGRPVATVHEWVGVLMLALPVLAVLYSPRRVFEAIRLRSRPRGSDRFHVHVLHLWFTLISGVMFITTGFVMWFQRGLPDAIVDPSIQLHVFFSYALYVAIAVHVVSKRRRILRMLSTVVSAGRGGSAPVTRAMMKGEQVSQKL